MVILQRLRSRMRTPGGWHPSYPEVMQADNRCQSSLTPLGHGDSEHSGFRRCDAQ
jgi:hypothetical protein